MPIQEEQLKVNLNKLFDLSRKDAMSSMTNQEDKIFLKMQQAETSCKSMFGVDKI